MARALPIADAKLPTSGILSFGYQRSPTHIHNGIDIPRPEGTPVYAAEDGVVAFASETWRAGFSGYGSFVVIAHPGGEQTLYAHLRDVMVRPNQAVRGGQQIGTVGHTAFTRDDHESMLDSGPHLHFEVSATPYPQESEASRLNPVDWLQNRRPLRNALLVVTALGVAVYFYKRRKMR